jgi:hypothetical protein
MEKEKETEKEKKKEKEKEKEGGSVKHGTGLIANQKPRTLCSF